MKKYIPFHKQYDDITVCERTIQYCLQQTIKQAYEKLKYDLFGNKTISYYIELPSKYAYLENSLKKISTVTIREDLHNIINIRAESNRNLKKFVVYYSENTKLKSEKTTEEKMRYNYEVRIIVK